MRDKDDRSEILFSYVRLNETSTPNDSPDCRFRAPSRSLSRGDLSDEWWAILEVSPDAMITGWRKTDISPGMRQRQRASVRCTTLAASPLAGGEIRFSTAIRCSFVNNLTSTIQIAKAPLIALQCYSDEAGHAFQSEAGHLLRSDV